MQRYLPLARNDQGIASRWMPVPTGRFSETARYQVAVIGGAAPAHRSGMAAFGDRFREAE